MKFVAKVIKFGRITIPTEIRDLLDIEEGDYVIIDVEKARKDLGEVSQPQEVATDA